MVVAPMGPPHLMALDGQVAGAPTNFGLPHQFGGGKRRRKRTNKKKRSTKRKMKRSRGKRTMKNSSNKRKTLAQLRAQLKKYN